jgi:hypothetical protein
MESSKQPELCRRQTLSQKDKPKTNKNNKEKTKSTRERKGRKKRDGDRALQKAIHSTTITTQQIQY